MTTTQDDKTSPDWCLVLVWAEAFCRSFSFCSKQWSDVLSVLSSVQVEEEEDEEEFSEEVGVFDIFCSFSPFLLLSKEPVLCRDDGLVLLSGERERSAETF